MRKFYGSIAILVLGLFVSSPPAAHGSQLVLRTTRDISSPDTFAEVATIDVSRYERLRISVTNTDQKAKSDSTYATFSLDVSAVEFSDLVSFFVAESNITHNSVIEAPPLVSASP